MSIRKRSESEIVNSSLQGRRSGLRFYRSRSPVERSNKNARAASNPSSTVEPASMPPGLKSTVKGLSKTDRA